MPGDHKQKKKKKQLDIRVSKLKGRLAAIGKGKRRIYPSEGRHGEGGQQAIDNPENFGEKTTGIFGQKQKKASTSKDFQKKITNKLNKRLTGDFSGDPEKMTPTPEQIEKKRLREEKEATAAKKLYEKRHRGGRKKTTKVKKAELTDITDQQKKRRKDKEKLLSKSASEYKAESDPDASASEWLAKYRKKRRIKKAKGVAPNYNNPSKVKKTPPQGPKPNADTPEEIIQNAEIVSRKNDTYIGKLKQRIAEKKKRDYKKIESEEEEEARHKKHGHVVEFKGHVGQYYKRASLVASQGKYAKYWLLNAKQTNGNGWGVSQQSIAKNIHKFIGRPLVVTAKSWHPESAYGDQFEHPYLPTNDINKVLDHQEQYRIGNIVDVIEKDGDYYANIEISQKFAHMILPPFCSPAIFQNNPMEAEGQISDWEALHLAALMEDPAYGSRIALLRGSCVGTKDQCSVQFKSAKQQAKMVCTKGTRERLGKVVRDRTFQNLEGTKLKGKRRIPLGRVGDVDDPAFSDFDEGLSAKEVPIEGNEIMGWTEEYAKKMAKLKTRLAGLSWEEQGYKTKPDWYGDTCPGCGKEITNYPALSREDNKTFICDNCGTEEAMGEFLDLKGKTKLQGHEKNKSKKLRKSKPGGFYSDRFGGGGKLGGLKKKEKTSDQEIDDIIKDIKDPVLKEDAINRLDKTPVGPKNYTPSLKDKIRREFGTKSSKLKQRLAGIPDPDSPEGKKLIDDITDIAMKHRRKGIINSPKAGKPHRMRFDPSTPLIKEVPFGPEQPSGSFLNKLSGISVPKEQERKVLPSSKINRRQSRTKKINQRARDAEEIALDIMNDEKPSRFVNRKTKKIRPPKPVRSDFAEIITAKLKQRLAGIEQQKLAVSYKRKIDEVMKSFNTWEYKNEKIPKGLKKKDDKFEPLFTKHKGGIRGVRHLGNKFQYSGHYKRTGTTIPRGSKDKFIPHIIMEKTPKGIIIDNYGYDSGSTYRYFNKAGISTERKGNKMYIGGKPYDFEQGGKMLIPYKNITTPLAPKKRYVGSIRPRQHEMSQQTRLEATGDIKGVPVDPTRIQPRDQRLINKITGLKSKIPRRKILGTESHHLFEYSKYPQMDKLKHPGIGVSHRTHQEMMNPRKFTATNYTAKLRQRIGIKYFDEGQNIIKRTDARPTFLTPEGNYVGRPGGLFKEYSHSQYIEDIKDPNPGNYPNMGDYTDNPRVLDYMDREDMVRVNSYGAGTDVEVLNEPYPNQIKAIRKIFQEDATPQFTGAEPKHTKVSVWGMGDDGIFQKTNVSNYKDFRKVLKTNEWKNSLDSNMQTQIKEHWLQPAEAFEGRENLEGDVPDLHINRLGRDAKQKSARVEALRQRIGKLGDFDVERSHEGPVTNRKSDKAIKKFYEKKHKTIDEDRIKKIREEARLEGMLETGDKRIPLQKVDKPFHSKKPFLRSFTPENARKYAKTSPFPNPKNSFTIRLKKGLTDLGWEPRYVNYAIQNQVNQGWAKKFQMGTAQQYVRKNDLVKMNIFDANTRVNMKLGEIADVLPGTIEPRSGDTIFQRTGSPGKTQYFE